jgi:hypothetical protein
MDDTFSSYPPFEVLEDEEKPQRMTVGIGALCEDGRCVILGSDMRASYPGSSIDPHDLVGKQWHFTEIPRFESVSCAIAGRLGICTDIAYALKRKFWQLAKKKNRIHREDIARAIDAARWQVLHRYYDWALKTHFNMPWNKILQGEVPEGFTNKQAIAEGRAICDAYPFKAELIVSGFVDGEPLLFCASCKEELQADASPGVYVIGSKGARAAMNHLNRRGQMLMRGLASTLLHVHEAMEAARKADKEQIGPPAIYAVILFDSGLWRFDPKSDLLRGWAKAYKNREDTSSLETELAIEQVRAQLHKWEGHDGSRASDFRKSAES